MSMTLALTCYVLLEGEAIARKSVALLAAYMPALGRKVLTGSWADFGCRLAEVVDDHEGHVIDVAGEGWIVARFSDALKCTQCAVDIQRGMNEAVEEPAATDLARRRIGLNYEPSPAPGQVWPPARDDSVDRLVALAEPGGICRSRSVYDEIRIRIDLPFDTTRDPKHTAFVCQEIRQKLNSLNLLEAGAVRLGAAALVSRDIGTGSKDTILDTAIRAFKKVRAYFDRGV